MINNSYLSATMASQLSRNISDVRERIKSVSAEAVTGRVNDPTKHLSGQIGDAMMGQKALNDIERDQGLMKLRETRLDITQQSLTRMQEGISGLSARAINTVSFPSAADWQSVASDARSQLEASVAALSVRHGERYLFSGDATSTAPLPGTDAIMAEIEALIGEATDGEDLNARLDAFFDPETGRFANDIYRGTADTSNGDAITVLDPAIMDSLRSLSVLSMSGPGGALEGLPGKDDALTDAAGRLARAEGQLTQLRAETGIEQNRVAKSLEALEKEHTILSGLFNQMTARDQYEAAAELKSLETNLEASYLLTARLTQLSLLNFLR